MSKSPTNRVPWQRVEKYRIDLGTPGMDAGLSIAVAIAWRGFVTDDGPVYTSSRVWLLEQPEPVETMLETEEELAQIEPFDMFDVVAVVAEGVREGPPGAVVRAPRGAAS